MTNPPPMTDDFVGRLRKLLALATPRPWLIHSEPDVNYPATIHAVSTHRLGGVGDPIEPFGAWDQQLAVDAVNALPTLLARIEALEAEKAQTSARIDRAFEMGWRMATCSRDRNSFDEMQQAIADYRTAISYEPPHAD